MARIAIVSGLQLPLFSFGAPAGSFDRFWAAADFAQSSTTTGG